MSAAPAGYSYPAHVLAAASLIFLVFAWTLTSLGFAMFTDTDPLWHIAAGDVIRASGIPLTDPWSFTAEGYRWLNISWLWDAAFSWLREHGGWHRPIAVNAFVISLAIALVFANCAMRCGSAYAALLTTFGALSIMVLSLRPLQVSHCMVALWFFLLGQIFRAPGKRIWWLAGFPPLMLLWVNCHGGFIMGFVLLGAFFLQAVRMGNKRLFLATLYTLAGVFLASLCNPYGPGIVEAVHRPLSTVANVIIAEWRPFTFTEKDISLRVFLFVYLALLPVRGLPLLGIERALPLLWCLLSFTANRYLTIFAILAAPQVACAALSLARRLSLPPKKGNACRAAAHFGQPGFAKACLAIAWLALLFLPTANAANLFANQNPPIPTLKDEIAFLHEHAPGARVLTHFNLGGIIAYETRGALPVFVDARTETAFPPQVLADYVAFHKGIPGWQDIFPRYGMTAAILPNDEGRDPENDAIIRRMAELHGWHMAYKGPKASVFLVNNP